MKRLLISTFLLGAALILTAQPLKEGNLYKKAVVKRISKITTSPGGGSVKGEVKSMDIVYIYEKAGSEYYKVGTDEKNALGYMSGKDLQMWDTRFCIHFTPMEGRKPTLVFEDAYVLEDCLRGEQDFYTSSGIPHSASLALEPYIEKNADRFSMLLPILDKKRISMEIGINTLYEIGFLAGGESAVAPGPRSRVPKPISKVAELEVMFLVDATANMESYIRAVKDIIQTVNKRISLTREKGINFGITAFRDYVSDQVAMGYISKQFIDLTPNSRAVLNRLDDIHEAPIDSEDFPEALFDGYFSAITETSWKEAPNTLRIVVLIGNARGHEPGHAKNPLNYSLDFLLKKASENRVRTIAIKIDSGREEEDRLGTEQFFKIAEGASMGDTGHFIEIDHYAPNAIELFVEKASIEIEGEVVRLEKMIDIIEDTRPGEDIVFGDYLTSKDRALILKNLKTEKSWRESFVFSTGWISELSEEGKRNLETYAYLTKNEFDLMITYIKLVKQAIENPDLVIDGTLKAVIEAVTGERLYDRDLAHHYQRILGLPIQTEILKISSEKISTWGEELGKGRRMSQLIKEKLNSLEAWATNLNNWNTVLGGYGNKYTFVPLNLLP